MATIVHMPPNELPAIDAVWAVLSVDERGHEGIVAGPAADGVLMPLMVGNQRLVPMIERMARELIKTTGMSMRLVKFTNRETVREIR